MPIDWTRLYNRLFRKIDGDGLYFSGPKFIEHVKGIDLDFPDYYQYLELRRNEGKNTSRRIYFFDILMSFDEELRIRIINSILNELEDNDVDVSDIRNQASGLILAPTVNVDEIVWNSDRLNYYLQEIDNSITIANFERAISLSYTCLEGFYKAFIRANIPERNDLSELVVMSREIRAYFRNQLESYPDEVLNMINHISHTVDRTRNRFSESHFDNEAANWLAIFIRDLVNTQIRLLLYFM
ncbi:MAG: hypothetical protein H8D45_20170 [Bacteroidetes bacterium]|nr:hypothetical protein [Bacteroidota bacterium]MBL7104299.1 hypothetical protein [Bacteroidales bacterium]